MRVFVPATGLFTYPDVTVFCGKPKLLDATPDTLLNPSVPVEVLSPSTEAYDRGRKFEHYRSIDSVTDFILVASDRVQVDHYTRQPGGRWILTGASSPEDTLALRSIGCELRVSDVYLRIDLSETPPPG